MYEARTRAAGGIPVLVPMTPDAEFDVVGLIGAVTERTKILFLCTPNNPTGNRIGVAAIRRLLRLGLPTVIDEAYYELGESPESLAYLLAEFPNAIFLRTFSKAFGLAGLRVGYSITHPAVTRLLARVKLPWNVSGLSVAAALAALDDIAEQEERVRLLCEGRAYLARELRAMPGVDVSEGDANFVLVDIAGVAAEQVVARLLRRGILVRTLAAHHAGRSMVRITVGTPEQNAACVAALRADVTRLRKGRYAEASTDAE
jgi:histidinol-phosphate aminotransferase